MKDATYQKEDIRVRRDTSLVIWELLTRTLRNPDLRKEISPGNYELLFRVDEAERRALHYLAGAIERSVPKVNSAEMPDLIKGGRRWPLSRPR